MEEKELLSVDDYINHYRKRGFILRTLYKNLMLFQKPQASKILLINKNNFLSVIHYTIWNSFILELCKILSNSSNDKYTFHKFLNRIDAKKISDWNDYRRYVKNWRLMLCGCDEAMKKIKDERDKSVGHLDNPFEIFNSGITIEDFEDCLQVYDKLIKSICCVKNSEIANQEVDEMEYVGNKELEFIYKGYSYETDIYDVIKNWPLSQTTNVKTD